jgi:starch synthase (maltosyl-transferring)
MTPLGNDRWTASFRPTGLGPWRYRVAGWVDGFTTWRAGVVAKLAAGMNVRVELLEGVHLLASVLDDADEDECELVAAAHAAWERGEPGRWLEDEALAAVVRRHHGAGLETTSDALAINVDQPSARFSAWYELFPRSTTTTTQGTLKGVIDRLPYVAALGFDVLYLPPIHPIGRSFRKGRNNTINAHEDDAGSPWAIGASEGGHTAIDPSLGTEHDLEELVQAASQYGMAVALDLAFQTSPDHPWVREHPSWFKHRPDGTIQYAENPPKKYQDIYPFDFESEDWQELWRALLGVVRHWTGLGIRTFRVDNPHTKPFAFWEWLIDQVRRTDPGVIFLAEAFTRPRVMERLAKIGFNQSYTYFTWRQSRWELEQYFLDLSRRTIDYMRPNVWTNTPDILTEQLQYGGRPAFVSRAVLAATLAANWGVYGPAFELVEHIAVREGSEEYLDSEKYQIRHWDLEVPHTLGPLLAHLNGIRRRHRALQQDRHVHFHLTDNDSIICYSKRDPDSDDAVLVVVNLDPYSVQAGWVDVDWAQLGHPYESTYEVLDELTNARYIWHGAQNWVRLDPAGMPAHVLVVLEVMPG